MNRSSRVAPATRSEARGRARIASAYAQAASRELDLCAHGQKECLSVAAGLSVLAGIAASDAICAARRGGIHRGEHHREATRLLEKATPDGKKLATTLSRLLEIKDAAEYGIQIVSAKTARDALRWAQQLVERALDEIEK